MAPVAQIEQEMNRIVAEAQQENILLRLMGGLAFKLRCPSSCRTGLCREYPDLDFVTDRAGGKRMQTLFQRLGYESNRTFNTLNGDRRQLYYDENHQRQVDIFVGEFEMCHRLPVAQRLLVDSPTLPLAELFLTKAQIVALNRKDVLDMAALLLDHPFAPSDGENINQEIIAVLCAKDWGLYTTVQMNLARLDEIMDRGEIDLCAEDVGHLRRRIEELLRILETTPKTQAWKLRAAVGKRKRWYLEVEEVQR